jgi:hypothetical protein
MCATCSIKRETKYSVQRQVAEIGREFQTRQMRGKEEGMNSEAESSTNNGRTALSELGFIKHIVRRYTDEKVK